MSSPRKLVLGALTVWPAIYLFVFMGYMVTTVASAPSGEEPSGMRALFVVHLATMLLTLGLLVFYVAHAYRSPRVPDDRRTLWTILLLLGNLAAMPVYFWLYVRPEPPRDRAEPRRAEPMS